MSLGARRRVCLVCLPCRNKSSWRVYRRTLALRLAQFDISRAPTTCERYCLLCSWRTSRACAGAAGQSDAGRVGKRRASTAAQGRVSSGPGGSGRTRPNRAPSAEIASNCSRARRWRLRASPMPPLLVCLLQEPPTFDPEEQDAALLYASLATRSGPARVMYGVSLDVCACLCEYVYRCRETRL